MRTYVRARRSHHPACRPRCVLCVGRAARRAAPAGAAGDRRRRCGARVQLRSEAPRRAHRDERTAGARALPRGHRGPPRMHAYSAASKAVFAIFRDTTPLVEGLSIDEAFLEVGGLLKIVGSPVDIGTELRARVRAEVGLAITVGIARTKFLAKVASGVAKPDGLLLVPPDHEREFLHPL